MLRLAAVLLPLLAAAQNDVLENVSFRPPFASFDKEGKRQVAAFTTGGNAEVNENFVRLTPDRASKRGWLWAKNPLDAPTWTLTLRFRVSGQGKRLFGDGFALWFTQNRLYVDGPLHGFSDKFTGFGVLFDTFRNLESKRPHRDVSLMLPGGGDEVLGCDGDFRFWEGRDDFSVLNKSTVKITFNNNRVSVSLDAKNTGEFSTCLQDVQLNLPDEWYRSAYFGVTATTGQLADNHDILSFLVSTQPDKLSDENPAAATQFEGTGNPQLDLTVKATVAVESASLQEKLTHLHHHLEHQLSAIQDALQSNIKKLQESELNSQARIQEMENRLQERMTNTIGGKVDDALGSTLESRVIALESAMHIKFDKKIAEELEPKLDEAVTQKVSSAGRGWLLPFALLAVAVAATAAVGYNKYKAMLKTHLL